MFSCVGTAVSTSLFIPLEVVLLLTGRCIDVPELPSQNLESVYSRTSPSDSRTASVLSG